MTLDRLNNAKRDEFGSKAVQQIVESDKTPRASDPKMSDAMLPSCSAKHLSGLQKTQYFVTFI